MEKQTPPAIYRACGNECAKGESTNIMQSLKLALEFLDDVAGDEDNGGGGPHQNGHHPNASSEGRRKSAFTRRDAERLLAERAAARDQHGRDDILHGRATVRAGEADQQGQVGGDKRQRQWRQHGQQWEKNTPHPQRTAVWRQRLQVGAQRHPNHGETGAECEDWEQR